MTKNKPLISVLICNYNYAQYIEEALESVLHQSYKNVEIVVVDDGSKDNSIHVVKEYIKNHPKSLIRLKTKKDNLGVCYSRNTAIELANGEYFLFLDSDDTLPEDYIKSLYDMAMADSADVVYGDVKMFGDEVAQSNYPKYSQKKLLTYNYINISSLVKRSSIGDHKFDIELNRKTLEDYDFWLGLSLQGLKFAKAKNTYLNYRIQKKSRNDSSLTLDKRILSFVDIWKYSIDKYKNMMSINTYEQALVSELEYRVGEIGNELIRLNDVVQNELIPELKARADYIETINGRLLESKELNTVLESELNRMKKSIIYKISWAAKNPKKILKKIRKK